MKLPLIALILFSFLPAFSNTFHKGYYEMNGLHRITVNIPFDWHTQNRVLPAGPYEFQLLNNGVVQISDGKTNKNIEMDFIAVRVNNVTDNNVEVTFNKSNENQYLLDEILLPNYR